MTLELSKGEGMERLKTQVDNGSDAYAENVASMEALVTDLSERRQKVREGGRGVARQRELGKLPVRERLDLVLDPGTPFLEIGGLSGMGDVRWRCPLGGDGRRGRYDLRDRVHDRRERRIGEGRDLFPGDREEAPSRPGDRAGESSALCLPGRLWWGVLATTIRGLPGS